MSPRQSVVVAGGLGSGKSTVTSILAELGWSILDGDLVGHEALTDPKVVEEVSAIWPQAVIDGVVDRPALAAAVFSSARDLQGLESITHPVIVERIDEWLRAVPAPKAVEVSVSKVHRPEWGPRLVVHVDRQLRLQRVAARGMRRADAEARMATQRSDAEALATADLVIDNQAALADLREQVGRFDRWFRL